LKKRQSLFKALLNKERGTKNGRAIKNSAGKEVGMIVVY
jgi:hypothetical protein